MTTAGFVSPLVAEELPGLRLDWLTVPAGSSPSPAALRARLRALANRYRGAGVVTMRSKPVPHAYRAFFRQIGLDPDVDRIPAERAAADRLLQGGFRSEDLITDACLVALLETSVPVWALDAATVDPAPPGLGIRLASAEDCADQTVPAGSGALVVADARGVLCTLFDEPLPDHRPGRTTSAVTLFAIGVAGVPAIHVEEALWLAAQPLCGDGEG